jgi:trans-aconitate methyltransferase
MHFVGIDHAKSALEEARERFPETNVTFHAHDINQLETLDLGTFDLLISIGTLQSPGIHFKPLLMNLVQHYLSRDSALILGFPNSRWRDGEMLYGAKAAHYNFSEMGVVLEDILFAKRYLQQKKYRVMITGKHYLFLTAVRIGQKA